MKNPNRIIKYVDWTLLTILICLVLYAQIDGRFIHNTYEVIETCNGKPINQNYTLPPELAFNLTELNKNVQEKNQTNT